MQILDEEVEDYDDSEFLGLLLASKLHKPNKYNGEGDPKVHLHQVMTMARQNKMDKDLLVQWFPTINS